MLCFPLVTGWKNTRLQISLLPWHLRCGDATKSRAVSAQEVHKLFLLFAKAGCKDQHLSQVTTCSPLCSEELDGWERSMSQASLQGIKLCRRHWASTWPGIFLHQVEQLNKSFLGWGGVVLVFCLFLFNLKKKKKGKERSPWVLHVHYQAGKQTQYSSKQVWISRLLFRVPDHWKKHFLQGQIGTSASVIWLVPSAFSPLPYNARKHWSLQDKVNLHCLAGWGFFACFFFLLQLTCTVISQGHLFPCSEKSAWEKKFWSFLYALF